MLIRDMVEYGAQTGLIIPPPKMRSTPHHQVGEGGRMAWDDMKTRKDRRFEVAMMTGGNITTNLTMRPRQFYPCRFHSDRKDNTRTREKGGC